jgi:hypothetical protein
LRRVRFGLETEELGDVLAWDLQALVDLALDYAIQSLVGLRDVLVDRRVLGLPALRTVRTSAQLFEARERAALVLTVPVRVQLGADGGEDLDGWRGLVRGVVPTLAQERCHDAAHDLIDALTARQF